MKNEVDALPSIPVQQRPPNTALINADSTQQLASIERYREIGIDVIVVDIAVFEHESSASIKSRELEHRHEIEIKELEHRHEIALNEQWHQRRIQLINTMGEWAIKTGALAGGIFLTANGDVATGNFVIGAVLYTIAKDYVRLVWKKIF